MIDLALAPVGRDMVLATSGGRVSPVALAGAERVAQAVGIRLRCWLGEWFLDTSHGVPYHEQILGKGRRAELVEAVLRAQVLEVAGVRAIAAFTLTLDPAARTARVEFSAETSEGLATGAVALTA